MNQLSSIQAPPPPETGLSGPAMDSGAFARIAAIAYREAGLAISEGKSAMVKTRLARRLRSLKLPSYDAYCDFVESDAGAMERREMISALTTNVSHFFREEHHFDRLKGEVMPPLLEKMRKGEPVRIWSAGCSNGQEPYSIAMTLHETPGFSEAADIRILATDIDPVVVGHGRRGIYDERMTGGLPEAMRNKYFTQAGPDAWAVSPALRAMISFNELNLLHNWPMKRRFDVIFCRNVVIYFDAETQDRLWRRFSDVMRPGGWLFLGHSERVSEAGAPLFRNAGITAYQRGDGSIDPTARTMPPSLAERKNHGAS